MVNLAFSRAEVLLQLLFHLILEMIQSLLIILRFLDRDVILFILHSFVTGRRLTQHYKLSILSMGFSSV